MEDGLKEVRKDPLDLEKFTGTAPRNGNKLGGRNV